MYVFYAPPPRTYNPKPKVSNPLQVLTLREVNPSWANPKLGEPAWQLQTLNAANPSIC